MGTRSICFYGEIRKIFPELSSNTPLTSPMSLCILQYDRVGSFLYVQNDLGSFPTRRPVIDHYAASNITTNI